MRKFLISILLLSVVFFVWAFFFTPPQIKIDETVVINANTNMVNRAINDASAWQKWWPAESPGSLNYNGVVYHPQLPGLYAFAINVKANIGDIKTVLAIISKGNDSTILSWKGELPPVNNPFTRISRDNGGKKLSAGMKEILTAFQKFAGNPRNIYGIDITNEIVKDTLLLNTQIILNSKPGTDDIYVLVNKLVKAANEAGSPITGHPMMNEVRTNDSSYLLRVALPVSKPVKETNGIVIKRMIPGNILVSNDIMGGTATVESAFKQLMNYVQDHNKSMPAISFQSLITNRQLEKDSTKWITKIYCPVF